MYFFNQKMLNYRQSLTKFDEQLNTDGFNAIIKFNDLYNDRVANFYQYYNLPQLHLWEDGFTKGDATDEEVETLATSMNLDSEEVLTKLDGLFIIDFEPYVQDLIESYEDWCNAELAEKNAE